MKKLILIGQSAARDKKVDTPFQDIKALKTLVKWLDDAAVPRTMIRFLNAIPDRVGKRHLNRRDRLRYGKILKDTIKGEGISVVVCLGKLAEDVFYASGLEQEGVLATFLPYPSGKTTKDEQVLATHWLSIAYQNHILRERL